MLQADVCVLSYHLVSQPQYLGHTSVVPQPLTEPDKQLSHIRLFTQTFGIGRNAFALTPIRVRSVVTVFHALNRECVSPLTGVRVRELSLHGD